MEDFYVADFKLGVSFADTKRYLRSLLYNDNNKAPVTK